MELCRRRYSEKAFTNFLVHRRGFVDRHTSNTRLALQVRTNDIPLVSLNGTHDRKPLPIVYQEPRVVWIAPRPYSVPTLVPVFERAGILPQRFAEAA
ncbi:MAG: hypothetical protein A3D75_02800 [Candidatus Levybacteria bacterium RIFCSPHIGHO2_02_FULL_37_18]|nr:MAG: hypothetical protein A2770_03855 [Candidatus Levybacteria bacterium RIFCSPHIGHO2_01_FULL_38_12]OGH22150.1 MAG: hypothetical protein A3D75_02800 [Candidatus Levybacteria bacterium RIFCSPHIGHO2_02_FULL_37_18]OGH34169.1 MAG: hypothetical protein A3A47_03560 [Candidatus Levybacteria bacterium RIFCSPLOWO2_01_FULL_37_20]OGH44961.1 MAG: hypothetical protein A3J14_01225 [Candidatus Levybacteria bacterium RIFCSPLOWO2_02_FULL_37_18]